MVVSQTRPGRDCATAMRTGFHLGRTVFPKHSGKTNMPVSCTEARWWGDSRWQPSRGFRRFFPQTFPAATAPMAQPPRTPYSQVGGWVGTGLCQALLHPKRLSPNYSVLSKEGAFPFPPPRPSSRFPSLWINPPRRASLVQRVSLPPGEHGHTKEALLHCPPTAPTHGAADPAPHSPPHPFSSHKYSSGYTPLAFGGSVSFPPPALLPTAKGLKHVLTVFTGVRSASSKHTNPGQKSLWEKQGQMPGYEAPSQTSDRNLSR